MYCFFMLFTEKYNLEDYLVIPEEIDDDGGVEVDVENTRKKYKRGI